SIQDAGRHGAMRYGVSTSGPMDWVRFQHALSLAGEGTSAAFEVGLAGAGLRAEGDVVLGLTGPGFRARRDGDTAPTAAPARIHLRDGETLTVDAGSEGMWAYIAVAGLDLGAPLLGSYATNARTGLGGRDLTAGFDIMPHPLGVPSEARDIDLPGGPIGLLPGPQHHLFDDRARDTFVSASYTLTSAVDRMGYKLEGAPLRASTHDIISDGIVEGAIQVPGNGQPIVLCADRAPTGGYPKIGVVARADLPRLTQTRPGTALTFVWLTLEEAHRRRRALAKQLSAPPQPRVRTSLTAELLASHNLVSGVTAG
ncbi:MAG: urea amidolyase, partial [Pseudomonadota bacterium]